MNQRIKSYIRRWYSVSGLLQIAFPNTCIGECLHKETPAFLHIYDSSLQQSWNPCAWVWVILILYFVLLITAVLNPSLASIIFSIVTSSFVALKPPGLSWRNWNIYKGVFGNAGDDDRWVSSCIKVYGLHVLHNQTSNAATDAFFFWLKRSNSRKSILQGFENSSLLHTTVDEV